MADTESETVENLKEIFEADWEESAPLMGPPTHWAVGESYEDANLYLGIDFSPLKNKTNIKLEVNGGDFSFAAETHVDGFDPSGALGRMIGLYQTQLVERFGVRADAEDVSNRSD